MVEKVAGVPFRVRIGRGPGGKPVLARTGHDDRTATARSRSRGKVTWAGVGAALSGADERRPTGRGRVPPAWPGDCTKGLC